eukprot:8018648-Pyramimonas_sp.AAC.2
MATGAMRRILYPPSQTSVVGAEPPGRLHLTKLTPCARHFTPPCSHDAVHDGIIDVRRRRIPYTSQRLSAALSVDGVLPLVDATRVFVDATQASCADTPDAVYEHTCQGGNLFYKIDDGACGSVGCTRAPSPRRQIGCHRLAFPFPEDPFSIYYLEIGARRRSAGNALRRLR